VLCAKSSTVGGAIAFSAGDRRSWGFLRCGWARTRPDKCTGGGVLGLFGCGPRGGAAQRACRRAGRRGLCEEPRVLVLRGRAPRARPGSGRGAQAAHPGSSTARPSRRRRRSGLGGTTGAQCGCACGACAPCASVMPGWGGRRGAGPARSAARALAMRGAEAAPLEGKPTSAPTKSGRELAARGRRLGALGPWPRGPLPRATSPARAAEDATGGPGRRINRATRGDCRCVSSCLSVRSCPFLGPEARPPGRVQLLSRAPRDVPVVPRRACSWRDASGGRAVGLLKDRAAGRTPERARRRGYTQRQTHRNARATGRRRQTRNLTPRRQRSKSSTRGRGAALPLARRRVPLSRVRVIRLCSV